MCLHECPAGCNFGTVSGVYVALSIMEGIMSPIAQGVSVAVFGFVIIFVGVKVEFPDMDTAQAAIVSLIFPVILGIAAGSNAAKKKQ